MSQTNPNSYQQQSSTSTSLACSLANMNDEEQPLSTRHLSVVGNSSSRSTVNSNNNKTNLIQSTRFCKSTLAYISIITLIVILSIQLTGTKTFRVLAQSTAKESSPSPVDGNDKKPDEMRNLRDLPLADKLAVNASNAFEFLLRKKPYSKYWTVEQKWDDLFKRFVSVQGTFKQMMLKNFMRDLEYYADVTISPNCERDLKYIQTYMSVNSRNTRWLSHMLDSTGKNEPGMLTGNLAHLGHVVQCIKVRAPAKPTNDTFDERYFDLQTETLGERFRGKYCLASIRPVLPEKPKLISRFTQVLNASLLSNVSYTGEPSEMLKRRARQLWAPKLAHDRNNLRLDQIPFESELYEYLIRQRNFMYTLPRYMGVCYPSSCSQEDVRVSLQKTMDDQHQVVDIEFECEQEDNAGWRWFSTSRLVCYVIFILVVSTSFLASVARHILVDRMMIRRSKLDATSRLNHLLGALEQLSMDKCAGILFIKTRQASPYVDWSKMENNRSTSIDALKGFMLLMLIYSQMTMLGCLPVPFMWTKWADAMFPFYRSIITQVFLNTPIWTEGFYMISAYLIALKLLENCRPKLTVGKHDYDHQPDETTNETRPNLATFVLKRYVRLLMPMVAFILMNYVWPRLSNGFVMQDQANKILAPCDNFAWTNLLMFHNHNYNLNETCLWPSHVSASFFQLHLISWPILMLCLYSFKSKLPLSNQLNSKQKELKFASKLYTLAAFTLIGLLVLIGCLYPGWKASQMELVVPFLIDYIDYDNYQRVIEWMVVPTYNHLASYMIGLALAYLVVRKRVDQEEQRQASSSDWSGHYINRENSFESVRSSSTQELHSGGHPVLFFSNNKNHLDLNKQQQQQQHRLGSLYEAHNEAAGGHLHLNKPTTGEQACCLLRLLKTTVALLGLVTVLASSWYWNGLGQPMSKEQTFVFVSATKLCFCLIFGYLFYVHFATRKNANNPWMITRFLVPIGRMSLMLFYVSWLVIWFDLLSSPFQWHPSHYFISEKYSEIIFMSLVLSMFAYGAFEGTIKRVQYANRSSSQASEENVADQPMSGLPTPIDKTTRQERQAKRHIKSFESFFHPTNKKFDAANRAESSTIDTKMQANQTVVGSQTERQQQPQPVCQSTLSIGDPSTPGRRLAQTSAVGPSLDSTHLSPSDQYKLNAELRANYSFASIGLYESVGATGDLSQGDPQVSPAPSHRRS